ncbi:MAG: Uma2 family endonuclease [Planctomycetes bacterium]|nr:Uma2 family endonuclease [Planctomycetota bacterium]
MVGALFRSLLEQVEDRGHGVVLIAPTALRLSGEDGLEPDLMVVLHGGSARVLERDVQGAPALVIEVLSRSSRRLDLGPKLRSYEQHGIGEYWVVDPDERSLLRFPRVGDRFGEPTRHVDVVSFTAVDGCEVDLRRAWARLDLLGA